MRYRRSYPQSLSTLASLEMSFSMNYFLRNKFGHGNKLLDTKIKSKKLINQLPGNVERWNFDTIISNMWTLFPKIFRILALR